MEFLFETDRAIVREIGRRIKARRLKINISQQDLAIRAGVNRNTIKSIEAGKDIRLITFIQILRVFDNLKAFNILIPEILINPKQEFINEGKKKKRAYKSRRKVRQIKG